MKKYIFIIALSIGAAVAAQAQDKNQDIAEPGWVFKPVTPARRAIVTTAVAEKHDVSLGEQIKKGMLPGMQVQRGGTTATKASAARSATPTSTKLLSDAPAPKTQPAKPSASTVPTQNEAPAKQ